jgi:hypothetical protein
MTQFYVYRNEQVEGPYLPEQILELDGFTPDHLVCGEGTETWTKASEVPEIAKIISPTEPETPAALEGPRPAPWYRSRRSFVFGAVAITSAALVATFLSPMPPAQIIQSSTPRVAPSDTRLYPPSSSVVTDTRLKPPPSVERPSFGLGIYLTPSKPHLAEATWPRLAAAGVQSVVLTVTTRDLAENDRLAPTIEREILAIRQANIQVIAHLDAALWRNRDPRALFRDTSLVGAAFLVGCQPEDSISIMAWSKAIPSVGIRMINPNFDYLHADWWEKANVAVISPVQLPSFDRLPPPAPDRFSEGQREEMVARGRKRITVAFTIGPLTNRFLIEACHYDSADSWLHLRAQSATWFYENAPARTYRIPDFTTPPGAWFLDGAQLDPAQIGKNLCVVFTADSVPADHKVLGQITEEVWDESGFRNAWKAAVAAAHADDGCAILVQVPPRFPQYLLMNWMTFLSRWGSGGIFFPSDQADLLIKAAQIEL